VNLLDRIANIAVIVAVVVFLILVSRNELFRHTPVNPGSAEALVGKTISVPGVTFSGGQDSLVLGISSACHFCKDSLPFYRQITAQSQGRINVIAVLPQPQSEAEAFVRDAGLAGTQVISAPLASIGVYGTPTLLLVDGHGKVKTVWVGKQDDAGQRKILAALLPPATAAVPRSRNAKGKRL